MIRPTLPAPRLPLLLLLLLAPLAGAMAQDTPETLAAMQAMWPPLPAEIPAWESLPAEVRQELAALRIEVHRWHADPAQRFVMVGGRRVDEGGVLGQELWLREIRPESVVVQYRKLIFERAR
jgi:hypothetical protein